jgi:serpin B
VVALSGLSLAAAASPAGAPVDARAGALASAYNASGQQLFAQFAASPGNVVFSPYSIGAAMAMALAGAHGATETEMLSVLQHKLSPADVNAANAELLAVLDGYDASAAPPKCPPPASFSDGQCEAPKRAGGSCPFPLQAKGETCVAPPEARPSAKVAAADALAIGSGGPPVAADYLKLLERDYAAEVFRNATMTDVNDWVSRKTEGRIDAILSQPLDENAVVLVNAVYFNARWRSEFLASSTYGDAFHLDRSQTVQTPTMHKTENFALVRGPGFGAVALPYDVGGVEMVVVLPDAIDGVAAVAASLDAPRLGALFAELGAADSEKVDLTLPKFKTRFTDDHVERAFGRLGMAKAFHRDEADFSGVTGLPLSERKAWIAQIAHRAMIDVTEAGTEAAAATAVVMQLAAAYQRPTKEPIPFHVDRPFLFYVVEKTTGMILFEGRIVDPRPS